MIEELIRNIIASIFHIPVDGTLAGSIAFFIYDSIKIIFLMFAMIFVVGFIRTFISQQKMKKLLSGKAGVSHFFASIFGAITPFCSCSSIPFFMGFTKAGVPLGVSISFLVTSPLVNEYIAVIMWATLGWKIAIAYVISGILLGVISGIVIGRMKMEKYIEDDFKPVDIKEKSYNNYKERLKFGLTESWTITKSMWMWILLGVGIGALLHGYVPKEFLQSFLTRAGVFSVPIATLVGIPLYASCAAIVPIAVVLLEKGFPLGTTLAFMMATAALSFPEAILLRKIMNLRLIAAFFGIVALGIVVTGYLFNLLQAFLV